MKFRSQVYTAVSGSIGGTTYAHNKGGMYARGRGTPVNPNSARQQAVRNNLALLSTRWSQTLTQSQRDAWENWAANNLVTDAFGEPLQLSGQQMYIRCNAIRKSAMATAIATVDDGPTVQGLADNIIGTFQADDGDPDGNLSYDDTLPWCDEDGAALLIYMSRQQSPGIKFFKGPFRYAALIEGDSVTPPTTPEAVTSPFGETFTAGNRLFLRAIVTRADGRPSPYQNIDVIVQ